MTNNKKIKFGMFLLMGILLMVFVSAYSVSTTQYAPPTSSSNYLNSQGISLTNSFNQDTCQAGQDFVLQISPFGCTPTVVRSDLLEERNVPVFCELVATKINPLIEVEAIESISFKGEYPKEVSGVGFHPANAGINTGRSTLLNSPVLENVGYVVVVLKKQPNESAMPDWVQGNMTARIKYDVKNAFGIGNANYYLPQMSDEEWDAKYRQYGFWNGKGFLKADYVENEGARVSIYSDKENKLTSVSLTKGKTSGKINIPGFYCLASLQLRLDGLIVPDTRAKFEIDSGTVEVIKGEMFLDNACSVKNVDKKGLYQTATVYCRTDDGGKDYTFKIAPKVRLEIAGVEGDYELGEKIVDENKNYIYVGYIGAKKIDGNKVVDTTKKEDLIVYGYVSKNNLGDKLSDSKLLLISRKVEAELRSVKSLKELKIIQIEGGKLRGEKYGDDSGNVLGFAGAQDERFAEDVEDNYKNAIKTYDEIINSYSSLKFDEDDKLKDVGYGEQAFYDKIELAIKAGQKAGAAEFCEKFKEKYPESSYLNNVESVCEDYAIANSQSSTWEVMINGVVESIRFKGVYEPSQEEYSAGVSVGGEDFILTKNEIVESADKRFTVQLTSLNDDYAVVKMIVSSPEYNGTKTFTLRENVLDSLGSIKIVLTKINLKKQAKVSVIPSIDNAGTEANFTFKVGIEKRAIQLSPEKTKEKIKNLNETIAKWEKINKNLGNVVKGMKGACVATAGVLAVKSFFSGFSGKAAARHDVTKHYRDVVCKGVENMQKCLLDNNAKINTDVGRLAEVNSYRERIAEEITYDKEGKLVNSEKYLSGFNEDSSELLKDKNYKQELINLLHSKKKEEVFPDEAKKESAKILDELKIEYNLKNAHEGIAGDYGVKSEDVTVRAKKYVEKVQISNPKSYTDFGNTFVLPSDIKKGSYGRIAYGEEDSKNRYFVVFGKDGVVEKTYNIGADKETLTLSSSTNPLDLRFNIVDEKSYNNKFENPQVIYYEFGEYKGMPQVVPIDMNKGFYAATISGAEALSAYDQSKMPAYFYLCNVMTNEKQEFNLGRDDECVGVRVASNKADAKLPGLTESQTNDWARRGITAMKCAAGQYKAGVTKINCNGNIPVGNPATNIPGTQCEDFLSPADCSLLFNVCDPVICPSSRCNFGGKYRVSNVIGSGIIGSTLLCLPNFGSPSEGGVVIPVCLSGIHAGIDSLNSIYKNYGDCLQHSLDTGETVGICDEIHSIYLCEFFWKQAIPFMDITVPKVLEFFLTGGKGGGEYLDVQGAWANAGNAVNYMTNYYGANAYAAFKVRTTDEVGSAVCKNFISARYPASGDFFDALIEPDSPSQYHAWFHETTFTTATVPPTSQYKVYYHIYAGKDAGVYYSVYLKNPVGSSFYSDAQRVNIASGYIEKGGYASETKDILEVSGYKELCINVQGQEECGFKEVSTSFALNYVQDEYVKDQAERTDIKSEKECISGSASLYSMITPNIQAGAESVIDPQIYNQGIVRVCATNNPGESTDRTRWAEVGTCGGNVKCWIDTDSVGEAVVFNASLEGLEKVTENSLAELKRREEFMSDADFSNLLGKIESATDNNEKIKLITDALDKKGNGEVFLNREKAELLYLKAKAYVGLVVDVLKGEGVASVKPVVVEEKVVADTDVNDVVKKVEEETSDDVGEITIGELKMFEVSDYDMLDLSYTDSFGKEVRIDLTEYDEEDYQLVLGDVEKIVERGGEVKVVIEEDGWFNEKEEKMVVSDSVEAEDFSDNTLPPARLDPSVEDMKKVFEKASYKDYIKRYATEYGVEESLVKAIIAQESDGLVDSSSVGSSDGGKAQGLMQVHEVAAIDVGLVEEFNNLKKDSKKYAGLGIKIGVSYYNKLYSGILGEFSLSADVQERYSILAYNWGIGDVRSACEKGEGILNRLEECEKQIPFERRQFVANVLAYRDGFEGGSSTEDENCVVPNYLNKKPEEVEIPGCLNLGRGENRIDETYQKGSDGKIFSMELKEGTILVEGEKIESGTDVWFRVYKYVEGEGKTSSNENEFVVVRVAKTAWEKFKDFFA